MRNAVHMPRIYESEKLSKHEKGLAKKEKPTESDCDRIAIKSK